MCVYKKCPGCSPDGDKAGQVSLLRNSCCESLIMNIFVKKVVQVHAEVQVAGVEFKVYEDGRVFYWVDCGREGFWSPSSPCDDYYDEVQAAGLGVLK